MDNEITKPTNVTPLCCDAHAQGLPLTEPHRNASDGPFVINPYGLYEEVGFSIPMNSGVWQGTKYIKK